MANDLLQRPDEDQDRQEQNQPGDVVTPSADELEQQFNQPAVEKGQRNAGGEEVKHDELKDLYDKPARKDEDRNTDPASNREAKDKPDSPDAGSLLNRVSGGGTKFGVAKKLVGFMKTKRGVSFIGVTIALSLMIAAMLLIFPSLKLVHFTENIRDYFDGPLTEQMGGRIPNHLRVVTNADGDKIRGFEERGSIFGRVARTALYADLESRGFEVEFVEQGRNVGQLQSITVNGQELEVDDRLFRGQRGNRRILREVISELYPEEGWIRRGLRARTLYTRLGLRLSISRRLSNALYDKFGDRLDNNLTRGKAWLRQTLFGDTNSQQTTGVLSDNVDDVDENGEPTDIADKANEIAKDTDEYADEANNMRQELLDDPDRSLRQSADTSNIARKAASEGVEGATKGGLRGFFGSGLAAGADYSCRLKLMAKNIEVGSKVLRATQMAKYAFNMLKFADHMKAGKLTSAEVSGMMAVLQQTDDDGQGNMADSGAWRFISGDPTAEPSQNDLNKYGAGGRIPFVTKANEVADDIPGGRASCNVVSSPIFQIGAGVGSAFISVGSLGAFEIIDTAAGIGGGAVSEVMLSIGETQLTKMVAGTVITGDETGSEAVSALASGASSLTSRRAMSNGGARVTNAEYAFALRKAHDRRVEEQSQKTFLARMFDTTDHRSFIARLAIESPGSPSALFRDASLAPLRASPKTALAWLDSKFSQTLPHVVYAQEDPNALAVDMFGNPVFLLDQEALDKFEAEGNTDYLFENGYIDGPKADELEEYREKCFENYSIELADESTEGYHKECESKSKGPNDIYQRFRAFVTDEGVDEWFTEYTTRDYKRSTASDEPSSGTDLREGSAQQLAQEILEHPNIRFQTSNPRGSMQEIAATGRSSLYSNGNSETTEVSVKLLQLVLAAAEAPNMPPLVINSLSTGTHSATGGHYQGTAIDFDENGYGVPDGSANDNQLAEVLMPFLYNNREQLSVRDLFLNIPEFCRYNLREGEDYQCADLANHIHASVF